MSYVLYNVLKSNRKSVFKVSSFFFILIFLSYLIIDQFFLNTSFFKVVIESRVLQLIKEIPTEQGYGASISTRIARLYGGISIWLENPIIGDGWRNIKNMVFIDPFTGSYRYTLQGASTMSYYVSLLLKTGIIGFGIMMAIWIKVIKMLKPEAIKSK